MERSNILSMCAGQHRKFKINLASRMEISPGGGVIWSQNVKKYI